MEKYRFSEETRKILERMKQALAVYQVIDGRIVTLLVSDGFRNLFGYQSREQAAFFLDHDMYKGIHPDDRARLTGAALRFAESKDDEELDFIYRTHSGMDSGYRIIHLHGYHVLTETGVRIAQVWYMDEGVYDEDGNKKGSWINSSLNTALHEDSILNAAHYDELTGLPNLTWFFKLAEAGKDRVFSEGKQGILLYLDLDGMKYYNHQNGFAEGDKLLKAFSEVLARIFGKEDCCHISADRFAVSTTEDMVDGQLKQLFEEAGKMNGGRSLPVRAGVYSTSMEDVPISSAFDRAKLACDELHRSETSAANYYRREMSDNARRRQYIAANIDRAISEGWIKVYYQPIVRAMNGKVCEVEALARWIDPVEGILSPAEFIPHLENAGLIYKLDLCVLEQVLEKMQKQKAAGLNKLPHSINLSRSDFAVCDIVEEIRKRVDGAEISRELITIEITESVVGSDLDFMKEQIARFQTLGFPVWMDDFGSGYSSLDVLQSIRFDLIKFDMSFMRKLDKGESGKIILTELMKMATSLGIDTVCEGVETEEQVRFLQEIGCSKLQGFYFGRPIPAEKIREMNEAGLGIGYEDPAASAYFEAIGRVNLYDLGVIASQDEAFFQNTFNTLPMAILEIRENTAQYVRTNPSYRRFVRRFFGFNLTEDAKDFIKFNSPFMDHIAQSCNDQETRAFYNEKMRDGSVVHSFARRIGTNPVNGCIAVVVAVLSISDPDDREDRMQQQARIEETQRERDALAKIMALNEDYICLYSVDPETGRYVEYTSSPEYEALGFAKEGEDFFWRGIEDGKMAVYSEDLPGYLENFTKDKVLTAIRETKKFSMNYRLVLDGKPTFVSLKIISFGVGKQARLLAGVRKWRIRK